jgi:hypothetical protein
MYSDATPAVATCYAQLFATTGGLPTGAELSRSPAIDCDNAAPAKLSFNFSSYYSLTTGNKYAIIINTTESVGLNTFTRAVFQTTSYTGGSAIQKVDTGGAWTNTGAYDFNLSIFTTNTLVTSITGYDNITGSSINIGQILKILQQL